MSVMSTTASAASPTAPSHDSGMAHTEGGWPENVDPDEAEDVQRFRKRVQTKDDAFKVSVCSLGQVVSRSLCQNASINIYQRYFEDEEDKPVRKETPNLKAIAELRDPGAREWQPPACTVMPTRGAGLNRRCRGCRVC